MKRHYLALVLVIASLPLVAEEQPHWAGLAIQHDADYLGAPDSKYLPIPLFSWEQDSFFLRSSKGIEEAGIHWQFDNGFTLGSQLAVELGRDSKDSELLKQLKMPDIPYGASLGVHLEHSTHIGPAPLSTLLRLRQRSGSDRGALADLRMELGIYGTDRIGLQTYVQTTWANQTAMRSDFGIKAVNASYSDIQPYSPTSGIRDTVIGLAGKFDINPDWMLVASLERKQLRKEATDSPITEEKNANIFTVGAMHRF